VTSLRLLLIQEQNSLYLIEDKIEDGEWLTELITLTEAELPTPKPKKKKKSKK